MVLFRSLRNRSFALLWGGQTASRIGDFLYQVALAWWVLEKTGSATQMGLVQILAFLPMVIFLLLGGVAVDRLPRIPLMLASDIVRGLLVTAIALLALREALAIWHVYLASLLFGFVDAFFQPAYTALVPEVVAADDLPSANSITSMGIQLGRVAGPAIGALLIKAGGTPLAFGINALSFFISAALLLPLLRLPLASAVRSAVATQSNIVADVREGLATVLASPVLWISILLFALTNITLAGPYTISMPFLVKDYLQADAGTLGLLYAIFPIGYILGGIWLGRQARIRHRGLLAYGGGVVAGLCLVTFGLPVPLVVLGIAALLNGAALEIGAQIWANLLQELVPNEKLGRVASIDLLGSSVLLPAGFALTGWATEAIGPAPVFVIGGGLSALFALMTLAHPAIRRLD